MLTTCMRCHFRVLSSRKSCPTCGSSKLARHLPHENDEWLYISKDELIHPQSKQRNWPIISLPLIDLRVPIREAIRELQVLTTKCKHGFKQIFALINTTP